MGLPTNRPIAHLIDKFLLARFWSKVDRSAGPDACWPWLAAQRPAGYGLFGVAYKNHPAAKVAWVIVNGRDFPADHEACHSCDNPPCCNPAHVFPGTRRENFEDSRRKGRHVPPPKVVPPKQILSEEDVREIRRRFVYRERQALAAEFGISESTLQKVAYRETWRHVA
jgi:hypothetical protein